MLPTTPPSPPSSTASERVIVLWLESSRALAVWWVALHGLLVAAAALVGVAGWFKLVVGVAILAHGWKRWPAAAPSPILVAEDGSCCIPSLDTGWLAPGPRTLLAAYWLRLSLVAHLGTHDILLCMDQMEAATWARLNARLRRAAPLGTAAEQAAQRTGQADLR